MGTAVPLVPQEGNKYKNLTTMKAFVASALAAVAAAAVPVVKKVEVTAPVVTKTAVAPVVSYGYPYAYNTHFLAKREAEADPLTVFPAVPAVSAVSAVPAVSTVYKTPVVSATHGYSLGNAYTYGHNAAFYNTYPYNTYSGLYY